jgi:hypothetical protein
MKYYEFTCKTTFSGDKPAQSGIACVPDNHPLDLVEAEIAGALKMSEVTLTSADLDLENEFRRRREPKEEWKGTKTNGLYANLGAVEIIVF